VSSMIPNPMTSPAGAGTIAAPPTDDPNLQIDAAPALQTPDQYMLPQDFGSQIQGGAPMGAFTDAQYLADEAALRAQISQQYQGLLQQLGYKNPVTGMVVPGRLVQDANIQMAQYQRALQDAARQVTQNAQQTGTVFSGIRPQLLEQAQRPAREGESSLVLNTGRGLSDIYNNAQQLASQYNTQNNQLLAAAAQRQAAALMAAPPMAGGTSAPSAPSGGGAPPSGGGGTPPPNTIENTPSNITPNFGLPVVVSGSTQLDTTPVYHLPIDVSGSAQVSPAPAPLRISRAAVQRNAI
jgi:hypothetical protein